MKFSIFCVFLYPLTIISAMKGNKPKLVDKSTGSLTLQVSQTARLKCNFLSWKREWKLVWKVNGKVVQIKKNKRFRQRNGKSSLLRIKRVVKADSGMYECIASNDYGSVSKLLNLTVVGELKPQREHGKGPPRLTKGISPQLVTWPASGDLKLRCPADGEPRLKYQWFKDGKVVNYRRLDAKFNSTRWYLRIKTAVPSDNGIYKCVVSNRLGNISHEIKLTVIENGPVRPVLSTQFPVNKTARVGGNVTFKCIELFSPILTHYRWLHWNRLPPNYPDLGFGDDPPSFNSTYYTEINPLHYQSFPVLKAEGKYGGSVLLTNVTKEDEGMYTCLISNFIGKSWRSAFLRVLNKGDKPNLVDKSADLLTLEVGETARLKCKFYSWKPEWKMVWKMNGKVIQIKNNKRLRPRNGRSSLLRIKALVKADSGMYECIASNDYGSVRKLLNLTVVGELKPRGEHRKGPPWFTEAKKPRFVAWPASADMILRCPADGEPPLKYQWFKDGKVLNHRRRLDPKFNSTRWYLRIRTAVPSDNGFYQCVVSNRLGSISHKIKLTVIEKGPVRPVLSAQFPVNKTAQVGDNVSFQCIELFSPILTDYKWLHWNRLPPSYPDLGFGDDPLLFNSTYYTVINPVHYHSFSVQKAEGKYGGRVLLTNVTKEDEGMYTCLISNHVGKGWKSAFLRVLNEGFIRAGE